MGSPMNTSPIASSGNFNIFNNPHNPNPTSPYATLSPFHQPPPLQSPPPTSPLFGHRQQSFGGAGGSSFFNSSHNTSGFGGGSGGGIASPLYSSSSHPIPPSSINPSGHTNSNPMWMGQPNYLPCFLAGEINISPGKKEILAGLLSPGSKSSSGSPHGHGGGSGDSFLYQSPHHASNKPNFVRKVTFEDSPADTGPKGPPKTGIGFLQNEESPKSFLEASARAGSSTNGFIDSSMGFTPSRESPSIRRSHSTATATAISPWVTIFGFPPGATSFVLTTFSSIGTIIESRSSPGSNWIHLKFASKIEAKKALAKNGSILAGSTMIGVTPCLDPSMNLENEPLSNSSPFISSPINSSNIFATPEPMNRSVSSKRKTLGEISSPPPPSPSPSSSNRFSNGLNNTKNELGSFNSSINGSSIKSRIRPLSSGRDLGSIGMDNVPKESTGYFTKAMEYLFSW